MYVDPSFVKESFNKEGFELSSDYVNSKTYLNFICPQGHTHKTTWNRWRSGQRCGACKYVDPEKVKESFAKEGYKLLSNFERSENHLNFLCPQGHSHQMSWNSWQQGSRCLYCSGLAKLTTQEIAEAFKKEGFELLSDYTNSWTLLKFKCPKGHQHQIKWNSWQQGKRCGLCYQESTGCLHIKTFRIKSVITNRIGHQLLGTGKTWRDFYDESEILSIGSGVLAFYQKRVTGISVDHIVPCSWFDLTKKEELTACWDPKNLRHLPLIENLKRYNRLSHDEFLELTKTHSSILCAASRIPSKYKKVQPTIVNQLLLF